MSRHMHTTVPTRGRCCGVLRINHGRVAWVRRCSELHGAARHDRHRAPGHELRRRRPNTRMARSSSRGRCLTPAACWGEPSHAVNSACADRVHRRSSGGAHFAAPPAVEPRNRQTGTLRCAAHTCYITIIRESDWDRVKADEYWPQEAAANHASKSCQSHAHQKLRNFTT